MSENENEESIDNFNSDIAAGNMVGEPMKKKRKQTSSVWDHFSRKQNSKGLVVNVCGHEGCDQSFSVNSSTGTLKQHLRRHGFFLNDNQSQQRFTTSGSLSSESTTALPINQLQTKYEILLCKWIVSNSKPFSTVEDETFIEKEKLLNHSIRVPSRNTVRRRIMSMFEEKKIAVLELLKTQMKGKISLTADAWSSQIYRGYMAVTGHFIDNNWKMRSLTLEFNRFPTPHNAEATCSFLSKVIESFHLQQKVQSITTDNAKDVSSGVQKLHHLMREDHPGFYGSFRDFHIRCISHVVNLAVKDCMKLVHKEIEKIRSVCNAIRCSTKRRDKFGEISKQLKLNVEIPCLDTETRWSSTFTLIKKSIKAKRVINSMVRQVPELCDYIITDDEWTKAGSVCEFLESAATLTERQSGSQYVTLSINSKLFNRLRSRCESQIGQDDATLKLIAEKMLEKLNSYSELINTELSDLSRILDPRIRNDCISDTDILRSNINLPQSLDNEDNGTDAQETSGKSILDNIFEEDSLMGVESGDEIARFIRATSQAARGVDALDWWKENESKFPTIASRARDVLAVQASSVASESVFSRAGCLIDDKRTRLGDDSIRVCMLLNSWVKI